MNKDPIISCQCCNYTDKQSMFSLTGAAIDEGMVSTEYQCPRCEGLFEFDTIADDWKILRAKIDARWKTHGRYLKQPRVKPIARGRKR